MRGQFTLRGVELFTINRAGDNPSGLSRLLLPTHNSLETSALRSCAVWFHANCIESQWSVVCRPELAICQITEKETGTRKFHRHIALKCSGLDLSVLTRNSETRCAGLKDLRDFTDDNIKSYHA
jgi:hypothetical protein